MARLTNEKSLAPPEVRKIFEEVRDAYHKELKAYRVLVAFQGTATASHGKLVAAKISKANDITNLSYLLAEEAAQRPNDSTHPVDYVLLIAKDLWNLATPAQRIALIDHELQHTYIEITTNLKTGELKMTTRIFGHDVETFSEEINRHGLWTEDLFGFFQRLDLDKIEADLVDAKKPRFVAVVPEE